MIFINKYDEMDELRRMMECIIVREIKDKLNNATSNEEVKMLKKKGDEALRNLRCTCDIMNDIMK